MPDIVIKYMDNQSNLLFNDFCKRQMRTGVTFLKTKHMHTCTHTSRMCFEKEKQGPDDRHGSGMFRQLYFLRQINICFQNQNVSYYALMKVTIVTIDTKI